MRQPCGLRPVAWCGVSLAGFVDPPVGMDQHMVKFLIRSSAGVHARGGAVHAWVACPAARAGCRAVTRGGGDGSTVRIRAVGVKRRAKGAKGFVHSDSLTPQT